MVARLLEHSDLKILTKIYDHTSTETLRKVLLETKPGAEAKKRSIMAPLFTLSGDVFQNCRIFVVQLFSPTAKSFKKQ